MQKKWFANTTLVLLFTFLSVCVVEFILDKVFPIGKPFFQYHPIYLFEQRPNARRVFFLSKANGGGTVVSDTDQFGFRGPERDFKEAKPVLVWGDSFVAANYTPYQQTFCNQLEQYLKKLDHRYVVVNAGVAGYGPDQVYLRMQRDIEIVRPTLAILVLFAGNDFGDLIRNGLFVVDEEKGLLHREVNLDSEVRKQFEKRLSGFFSFHRLRGLVHHFRQVNFGGESGQQWKQNNQNYVDRFLKLSREDHDSLMSNENRSATNLFMDYINFDISLDKNSESAQFKKSLMGVLLSEISLSLKASRIPSVALVVPSAIDVSPQYEIQVNPDSYSDYERSYLTDSLTTLASNAGIKTLDLFPVFFESDPNGLFFHYGDLHWNSKGQQLAAEATWKFLLGQGLVKEVNP